MEYARALQFKLPLMRGDDVRAVQQALIALKVEPPCGGADGVYGPATADAVKGFQAAYSVGERKLARDGIVGPQTWEALFGRIRQTGAPSALLQRASSPQPPVNQAQARRVRDWLEKYFDGPIKKAIANAGLQLKPALDFETVCAIAAKEAACYWLRWVDDGLPPETILGLCVFDASGDVKGHPRSAFPRNTAEFQREYPELTPMLIAEANRSRAARNLSPAQIVYKGYGIFQYDLQHIRTAPDRRFFEQKLWYSFDECLVRLISELKEKAKEANSDSLQDIVRRYNGSGPNAVTYADNVMTLKQWMT